MSEAGRAGLKAAAESLARTMRRVAAVRTRRTADAVNTAWEGDVALVRGGRPGGAWGWEPVTAFMFDDDGRHPLFGDKKHWYHQGEYPITELTVETGINEAADRFAEAAVPLYLKEAGITE
jgi:hypothetical protein